MKASAESSPLLGRWRIVQMEAWDNDYLDAEEPAFIRFDPDNGGEFHFGYVHGWMDCCHGRRDGQPAVEWSWEGNDEHHPAMGRGWAVLQEDGILTGGIFFHQGEESSFRARKASPGRLKRRRSGKRQPP